MKVEGLDGRRYTLDIRDREVGGVDHRDRSGPHRRARGLLKRIFPLVAVMEEVPLPGSGGLTADFLLPSERMVVEVHGIQHREYVPYFHGNMGGFLRATRNDKAKSDWCHLNGMRLVILFDTEGDDDWQRTIRGR